MCILNYVFQPTSLFFKKLKYGEQRTCYWLEAYIVAILDFYSDETIPMIRLITFCLHTKLFFKNVILFKFI